MPGTGSSRSRRKILSEPPPARGVRFTAERLYLELGDGWEIGAPLVWFPRLCQATPAQREHWELLGGGMFIHWPDVDEDIAVAHLFGLSD